MEAWNNNDAALSTVQLSAMSTSGSVPERRTCGPSLYYIRCKHTKYSLIVRGVVSTVE